MDRTFGSWASILGTINCIVVFWMSGLWTVFRVCLALVNLRELFVFLKSAVFRNWSSVYFRLIEVLRKILYTYLEFSASHYNYLTISFYLPNYTCNYSINRHFSFNNDEYYRPSSFNCWIVCWHYSILRFYSFVTFWSIIF